MKSHWTIALVVIGLVVLGLSFVGSPSPAPAAAPRPIVTASLAEKGKALFQAKGCAACHERQLNGAPNLRVYEPDPTFVRVWLRDPSAVRPQTWMPTLNLSEAEIDALIAFLEEYSTR